ncbi:DUF3265 domain-containing protein [Vibrio parahaemolyticus]|nr:DUF3265 domain-containing protein [Vibrio parahaemolyticus]
MVLANTFSSHITNALRRIRNAWRFWFDLAFAFTV